jgi:hypothetical protein
MGWPMTAISYTWGDGLRVDLIASLCLASPKSST